MKLLKQIIAYFLAVSMAFVCATPCFAIDSTYAVTDFWSSASLWAKNEGIYFGNSDNEYLGILGNCFRKLGSLMSGSALCAYSDDGYHHGDVSQVLGVSGDIVSVQCICVYCGKTFTAEIDRDDLESAYSTYVSTLDRTTAQAGISVTGYSAAATGGYREGTPSYGFVALAKKYPDDIFDLLHSLGVNSRVLVIGCTNSYLSGVYFDEIGLVRLGKFVNPLGAVNASVFGVYDLSSLTLSNSSLSSPFYYHNLFYDTSYAEALPNFLTSTIYAFNWSSTFYYSGSDVTSDFFYKNESDVSWRSTFSHAPKLTSWLESDGKNWYYPDTSTITFGTVHTLSQPSGTDESSRTASLMQTINNYNNVDNSTNFYIGTLNVDGAVENTYDPALYDEETLVFTEPITGAQYQTTGWTYDYETRTYSLNLADGTITVDGTDVTTIEIAYKDDCVAIDYYSADATVLAYDEFAYVIAEKVDPSACAHEYSSEITDPTCSEYGKTVYTCIRCGHTYTETIPALGHDWLATEVTATTYALPDGTSCPSCGSTAFTHIRSDDIYSCTCSDCGAEWSVDAVITYGSTIYTCSRCGEMMIQTDEPPVEDESWFNSLFGLFKTLISSIVNGFFAGIKYLFENVIGVLVDRFIQLIQWVFDLFDGSALTSWFDWFSDDNEILNADFGVNSGAAEVDVWAYS